MKPDDALSEDIKALEDNYSYCIKYKTFESVFSRWDTTRGSSRAFGRSLTSSTAYMGCSHSGCSNNKSVCDRNCGGNNLMVQYIIVVRSRLIERLIRSASRNQRSHVINVDCSVIGMMPIKNTALGNPVRHSLKLQRKKELWVHRNQHRLLVQAHLLI